MRLAFVHVRAGYRVCTAVHRVGVVVVVVVVVVCWVVLIIGIGGGLAGFLVGLVAVVLIGFCVMCARLFEAWVAMTTTITLLSISNDNCNLYL